MLCYTANRLTPILFNISNSIATFSHNKEIQAAKQKQQSKYALTTRHFLLAINRVRECGRVKRARVGSGRNEDDKIIFFWDVDYGGIEARFTVVALAAAIINTDHLVQFGALNTPRESNAATEIASRREKGHCDFAFFVTFDSCTKQTEELDV